MLEMRPQSDRTSMPNSNNAVAANSNKQRSTATLAARVAANPAGYLSRLNGNGPSLHFTILLENFQGYSVYGFDGQPDSIFQAPEHKLILSNFYKTRLQVES